MKITFLTAICRQLQDVLSETPLQEEKIRSLNTKIQQIIEQSLDKGTEESIKRKFHLDNLDEFSKKDAKQMLASRIFTEILQDCDQEDVDKIADCYEKFLHKSHPLRFSKEIPLDPSKEGLAKKYSKEGKIEYSKTTFKTILDSTTISQEDLYKTFMDELKNRYTSIHKRFLLKAEKATLYLGCTFQKALEKAQEDFLKNQYTPSKAVHHFFNVFNNMRMKNRFYKEKISKETFQDLIGNRVGGSGIRTPILIQDNPHINKLIEDCNNGSWKNGEERELIIDELPYEEEKNFQKLLGSIFNNPDFFHFLEKYFKSLE